MLQTTDYDFRGGWGGEVVVSGVVRMTASYRWGGGGEECWAAIGKKT
jgi:hypothetical protein